MHSQVGETTMATGATRGYDRGTRWAVGAERLSSASVGERWGAEVRKDRSLDDMTS